MQQEKVRRGRGCWAFEPSRTLPTEVETKDDGTGTQDLGETGN